MLFRRLRLSDEIHRLSGLTVAPRRRLAAGGLEEPSHIIGQCAHGLQALGVKGSLPGRSTIDDIPVLGGHDWHVHHLERHVQSLESSCGAAPSAHGHGCCRFAGNAAAVGVERPLDNAQDGSVGLAIINRRADNEGVGIGELLADTVADIVVKGTFARMVVTLSAGYSAPDSLVADPDGLAVDAVLFELLCDFFQCDSRVALLMRAAVNHQYFHCLTLFVIRSVLR